MEVINKYQNGKIYTLRSPNTEKYYIGSTVKKYLCNRLSEHNAHYKRFLTGNHGEMTSYEIIKLGDAYIELLELFPCNSKDELSKREGELIREHKNNCVNKMVAGRTGKEYNIECADKRKEIKKRYRANNPEKVKESDRINHQKQYAIKSDYIKNRVSDYRKNNSEKILCSCGSSYVKYNSSSHLKTKKHQDSIININENQY